jgi:hypothetical protein
MRIRLRFLRHKWTRKRHVCQLLMIQTAWPLLSWMQSVTDDEEHRWLWDHLGPGQSSFDIVLEKYTKDGRCVYPPILSLPLQ